MRLHSMGWRLVVGFVGLAAPAALADIPYFNGFETPGSVNDFYSPTNQAGGQITQVPSGGGTLGYTAAMGNDYAEIQNVDNDAGAGSGFGYAGYTTFGSLVSTHSTGFQQSVDIYVDLANWQPQVEQQAGSNLVISEQPSNTSGQLPSGAANDLVNFIFTVNNAGTVQVSSVAATSLATITTSGWYRFVTTFIPGSGGDVENDLSVQDLVGNTLGTAHYVSTLPAVQLGGSGDMVFGVWRNGFAGDTIGIDDLQTSAVPEPLLIGALPLGLALLRRRSQR